MKDITRVITGIKATLSRDVKTVLGRGLARLGLVRRAFDGCAVVVGFHRVTDAAPEDAMTLSPATFEAYCRFFRKNFTVTSLAALVAKLETGQPLAGELAISLDDGYADNHAVAAPILESLGLPATFFLTADLVGHATVPWWDTASPVPHPFMSWDAARDLKRRGFELGGHSASHADLGTTSGEAARREIGGGRDTLARELGTAPTLFAYPYGRPDAMTEANRRLVAEAGFRCCCGGAGAVNETGTAPMRMERFLISNWYHGPEHFVGHALIKRWRSRPASRT